VSTTKEDSAAEAGEAPLASTPIDFCPVGRALEIVGARWSLVLVRHLLSGPRGFQELRARAGIGPRVLSTRLGELIERGLVEKVPVGNRFHYALTEFGLTLEPVVREIALWWVRNAMAHTGQPFEATTPESALEAISFLLRGDRAREQEVTYDFRLTMRSDGGWTVEMSDTPARQGAAEPERAEGSDEADWWFSASEA